MLSHAVAYGAAAGVNVQALTRVDQSFARGIARGMLETRTSTAVIGWDGRASRHWIFGSVLDQVLEQTQQQVIVSKLGHPLNTTSRIVLVIPQGADHASGFAESVKTIKRIADGLTLEVFALAIADDPAALRPQLDAMPPATVPIRCEGVADWSELLASLSARVQKDDLVVVLGARRDTVAWHPALLDMPAQLSGLLPESFLIVYPPERADLLPEFQTRGELRRALGPARIDVRLQARTLGEAQRMLLEREYSPDVSRVRELETLFARYGVALEIQPGVVISHARVESLEEPLILLGITPTGITVPGCERPAQLLFIVLSPLEQPQQHLALLADVARIASASASLAALLAAADADAALALLQDALSGASADAQLATDPRAH
jgi:mannitol/fructose-specific phosphotransferase system IIA component (Ntr-type)